MRYLINLTYVFVKAGDKPYNYTKRQWAITLIIPGLVTDDNPDALEKYILSHLVTKHEGCVVKLLSFTATHLPIN